MTGLRMRGAAVVVAAMAVAGTGACDATDAGGTCGAAASKGAICTWAGIGEASFNGDGKARGATSMYWPIDIEFAPDGRGYLADWQNHRIRRVNADDRVETVIGSDFVGDGPADQSDLLPGGAPGTSVELNHPTDMAFQPGGELLLAAWHNHKIRRLDPRTGRVNVICGSTPGSAGDGMLAARATLNQPKSLVLDGDGNIFVTDSRSQRIRRIDGASGVIETVAGTGKPGFSGDGDAPLLATFAMQEINENPEPGGGIAIDREGRLYLADTFNQRIRRIDFAARTVATIAGNGTAGFGGDGGPATDAALNRPRDVEIGPDGRLYIADTDNHRIRAVDLATGVITTVAGSARRGFGGDGGPAVAATLERPFGIGFDGAGNLYIADTFNNRIRRVSP